MGNDSGCHPAIERPDTTGYPAHMSITRIPKSPPFKKLNKAQRSYLVYHWSLAVVCLGMALAINAPWTPLMDMHFGIRFAAVAAPTILIWGSYRYIGKHILPVR